MQAVAVPTLSTVTDDLPADGAGPPAERLVVSIPIGGQFAELLADRLFALGASAVSELVDGSGRPALVADLPHAGVRDLERSGVEVELLSLDPSWSGGWQQHAAAVAVGDRLVLRPDWVDAARDGTDRIEVVLDAANAFGSGSHPTTRLCLTALEGLVSGLPVGPRVLDVGCGTGVLGAAALLLGAGSLVSIDVDPAAVDATRRTLDLNGVGERSVEVSQRTVAQVADEHGPFDLVLANLLIPIVEELGPALSAALAPGGSVIVSGLLADEASSVESGRRDGHVGRAAASLGDGVEVVRVLESEGWAALEGRSGA